jgi:phenylpropionate dioxygenase-like ring-hydroxylating dioxygenase large terminal subunit
MPSPDALLRDLPLDRDPGRSPTLPSPVYTSPEIFAREREAIFFRGWHPAGHITDLPEPGNYITASIHDQGVFICRDKDGALRGFYNVCAHRAHELLKGMGRAKVITCPYHAWSYRLNGELRSARGAEGMKGFDPREFCLTPVRVETLGPLVFYNLDPEAEPLRRHAGDLLAELEAHIPGFAAMKRVTAGSSVLEANWKVGVDNYLECYHCAPAHPAFADLVDLDSYRSVCHKGYSSHIGSKVRPQNKAFEFDSTAPVQTSAFWWLWPMTTVNLMPGDPAVALFWWNPLSPGRTEQCHIAYAPEGRRTPQLERASSYSSEILSVEDNMICESVQRGLASKGYRQGRFMVDAGRSANSEHAVHHFHRMVAEALGL